MSLDKLYEMAEKRNELQAAWYRQILTIASGGFALLVGLKPEASNLCSKYLLAGSWLCLGLGIIAGAGATYAQANLADNLTKKIQEQLQWNLEEQGHAILTRPIVADAHRIFAVAKVVMIVSLIMAVVCLVAFSIYETLVPLAK